MDGLCCRCSISRGVFDMSDQRSRVRTASQKSNYRSLAASLIQAVRAQYEEKVAHKEAEVTKREAVIPGAAIGARER